VNLLSELHPRDRTEAASTALTLSLVAALVTVLFALLGANPSGGVFGALLLAGALLGLVLLASLLNRYSGDGWTDWAWRGWPLLAVLVGLLLALVTRDYAGPGQVLLLSAVLYGSSQLRRQGAIVVTGLVGLAELVVSFGLLSPRPALLQLSCLLAVTLSSSALLVLSGERREELLALQQGRVPVDPLTGLVTRRALDEAAAAVLARPAGGGAALILVDVDRFSTVNDEYGHRAGDEVLVQLAAILLSLTRAGDVVSRMSGDVIALLLPGCSEEAAFRRAEQILFTVRGHLFELPDGNALTLTLTAGVTHSAAVSASAGSSVLVEPRSLYRSGEAALAGAKRGGRDQVGYASARL
jgi:diguanylate cyclase (GGDEF)-like protein